MLDKLPIFEIVVTQRGRKIWLWHVCTTEGRAIVRGSEKSRATARYYAYRMLLQMLLTAPYHDQRERA
jgi:hypothetical protein